MVSLEEREPNPEEGRYAMDSWLPFPNVSGLVAFLSVQLQSGLTLQNVWRHVQEIAQHESLGSVTVVFGLLALLLMLCTPMARSHIRSAAGLFSIALLLVLTSSILAATGLPAGATTVYWAALICGAIAIVNLASLVVFDVALTLAHLHTPRILRDLVVACDWFLTARHAWEHYGWAGVADGKNHQRRRLGEGRPAGGAGQRDSLAAHGPRNAELGYAGHSQQHLDERAGAGAR